MKVKRRKFLVSALAFGAAGIASTRVAAADQSAPQFKLKFGHDQAPDHAYQAAAQYFADEVKKRTNGRVQIDTFPNAQLGEEAQMLDSVKMGTLDFSISSTSNAAGHIPQMGLLSAAYLFIGKDHLYKAAVDPQVVGAYTKLVDAKKLGFHLVTFLPNGARSFYSTKAIQGINDVQGMKMRVMASPIEIKVWSEIGAKPTTVPFNEVYTALQTNMVQAAENTPSSYLTAKHYEVAPDLALTEHEWLMSEVWVSDKTWQKLPPDIQKVVMAVGRDMAKFGLDAQASNDEKAIATLKAKGVKVVNVDKAPFIAKVSPLLDGIAKSTNSQDVLARIRELAK